MLRNSMYIIATLCNSEVGYNLTDADLSHLEYVDESLLRMIFETGVNTPKVMLYLELGLNPIRYINMNRRVMYLHYILNKKKTLLYEVFMAQSRNACKGDWTRYETKKKRVKLDR